MPRFCTRQVSHWSSGNDIETQVTMTGKSCNLNEG